MLVLSRREGESLTISLDSDIDPMTPACELFAGGPLAITVGRIHGGTVRAGRFGRPAVHGAAVGTGCA